ncbi:hypothetical protein RJT34_24397 [Clitoria ternatea]|uniref:Uncharacterized protein n=1 Tax=Clitoria ternatea TaxID=43366 RepID=A0AAN9FWB9_CLITE
MAKGIKNLSSWMEVAPAPIIFPTKPSNSPALETITEEAAAAAEENSDKSSINSLLKSELLDMVPVNFFDKERKKYLEGCMRRGVLCWYRSSHPSIDYSINQITFEDISRPKDTK